MTEHESPGARRRKAKHWIDALTITCVSVAIAIGTSQLVVGGLQEFFVRPPGVGASLSEGDTGGTTADEPAESAQIVPATPRPTPQPSERPSRGARTHHGPVHR